MKKNMGNLDRLIRGMLAATIGALYFKGVVTGLLGTILLILAVVFVLVSLVGFCPLYALFGFRTCKNS